MKTLPDHSERPHAEYGPSSLKHVNACAGWESRGGTNDAAEMGTRIHEAVEIKDPSALHNEKEVDIYNKLLVDLDGALEFLQEKSGLVPTVHQEIRLEMALDGCQTFGTADIVAIAGHEAVLHDHKTGIGHVDAPPENWQSTTYAIGVFQQFPEVRTIYASFSLPQRNELLVGEYHRDQLDEYIQRVSSAILAAMAVRPQWATGVPAWDVLDINNGCQYCLHRDKCPALGYTAQEIALRISNPVLPDGPIDPLDVEDPESLAKLYVVATIIEKWAKGIRAKAVELAKEGTELPGLKLKSMGSRKLIIDNPAFLAYADARGLSAAEVLAATDIPFAKVRDLYAGRAPKGKKTEWARDFEQGLDDERLLEKGEPRYTLSEN